MIGADVRLTTELLSMATVSNLPYVCISISDRQAGSECYIHTYLNI